jgi:hypothetical protein
MTVSELVAAASEVDFSSYEVELLEFVARCDSLPDYIAVQPFLAALSTTATATDG